MEKRYKTELYNDFSLFLFFMIIIILALIGGLIYLGKQYGSKLLSLWLPFLLLIMPFLLGKRIKSYFLKKNVLLSFDDSTFSIIQYLLDTDTVLKEDSFLWEEIEGYKFYFDTKKNTSLTLYMNKGARTFIFKDNKNFEEAVKGNSVFSNFYAAVKKYNNQNERQIIPKPNLLASNTGKFIILFQIILIVFAITLHLIRHNFLNSYYLLLAVGFLIPQIINRIQNKAMYEKVSKLE